MMKNIFFLLCILTVECTGVEWTETPNVICHNWYTTRETQTLDQCKTICEADSTCPANGFSYIPNWQQCRFPGSGAPRDNYPWVSGDPCFSGSYSQGAFYKEESAIDACKTTTCRELDLTNSGLTDLPADIFDGMGDYLEVLVLKDNQLTVLPDGIFDGLTSLTDLSVKDNQLTALPDGLFDSSTNLRTVKFGGNQLTTLPDGIFDGLASLQSVELIDNQLTTLSEDIFDDSPDLQSVFISGNAGITVLTSGTFDNVASAVILNDEVKCTGPVSDTCEAVAGGEFFTIPPGPCVGVICGAPHRGTCVMGNCQCKRPFTGSDCADIVSDC